MFDIDKLSAKNIVYVFNKMSFLSTDLLFFIAKKVETLINYYYFSINNIFFCCSSEGCYSDNIFAMRPLPSHYESADAMDRCKF